MSGICERGLMLMIKKIGILGALSELLEPHLFGRNGALKFGAIRVHLSQVVMTGAQTGQPACEDSYKLVPPPKAEAQAAGNSSSLDSHRSHSQVTTDRIYILVASPRDRASLLP